MQLGKGVGPRNELTESVRVPGYAGPKAMMRAASNHGIGTGVSGRSGAAAKRGRTSGSHGRRCRAATGAGVRCAADKKKQKRNQRKD